jgi:hypothetical protein
MTATLYQLLAIDPDGETRCLDSYATYQAAVSARGDDVFRQVRANPGCWLRIEHRIVGPGLAGPLTVHPFCTEVGVQLEHATVDRAAELAEVEAWLRWLHQDRAE